MAGLLGKLLRFLNKDLSGRTWDYELSHPHFENLVYFGGKDQSKCYWEAELSLRDLQEKINVTMKGTAEGPQISEEAFCRRTLSDLDGLFQTCRKALKLEYRKWTKTPFPMNWKGTFILDGISILPPR